MPAVAGEVGAKGKTRTCRIVSECEKGWCFWEGVYAWTVGGDPRRKWTHGGGCSNPVGGGEWEVIRGCVLGSIEAYKKLAFLWDFVESEGFVETTLRSCGWLVMWANTKTRQNKKCSRLTQRQLRLALQLPQDVPYSLRQGKGIRHSARPWIWHLWYVLRCKRYHVKQSIDCVLTSNCIRASLGVAELLIFHPVDTIAKRLMSNKVKVYLYISFHTDVLDSKW